MRRLMAVLVLLPLVACGDSGGADVDFDGDDAAEDRAAIHSEDGGVKMGLTDEHVYFALADSVRAAAEVEMKEDTTQDGIGGMVGGIVRGTVSRALSFRARFEVDAIRDIRWEDGRMVFDFVDPERSLDTRLRVDDRPVGEAFAERDVREFAEAFRELKRTRSP